MDGQGSHKNNLHVNMQQTMGEVVNQMDTSKNNMNNSSLVMSGQNIV